MALRGWQIRRMGQGDIMTTKTYTIEGKGSGWRELPCHAGDLRQQLCFQLLNDQEALVLVRKKEEQMKEERPDYNSPEWEKVDYPFDGSKELEYVILARNRPTPMPEIKPGDIINRPGAEFEVVGVFAVEGDAVNCFTENLIPARIFKSDITKIIRPNEGLIWERKP